MELDVQAENDADAKSVKHLTVSLLNYIQSSGAQAFGKFDPCSMQC